MFQDKQVITTTNHLAFCRTHANLMSTTCFFDLNFKKLDPHSCFIKCQKTRYRFAHDNVAHVLPTTPLPTMALTTDVNPDTHTHTQPSLARATNNKTKLETTRATKEQRQTTNKIATRKWRHTSYYKTKTELQQLQQAQVPCSEPATSHQRWHHVHLRSRQSRASRWPSPRAPASTTTTTPWGPGDARARTFA
jgi:hypothetical protein